MINKIVIYFCQEILCIHWEKEITAVHFSTLEIKRIWMFTYTFFRDKCCCCCLNKWEHMSCHVMSVWFILLARGCLRTETVRLTEIIKLMMFQEVHSWTKASSFRCSWVKCWYRSFTWWNQYNKRTIVTLIHVFFKPSRVFYISRKYIYNCTVNRLGLLSLYRILYSMISASFSDMNPC